MEYAPVEYQARQLDRRGEDQVDEFSKGLQLGDMSAQLGILSRHETYSGAIYVVVYCYIPNMVSKKVITACRASLIMLSRWYSEKNIQASSNAE